MTEEQEQAQKQQAARAAFCEVITRKYHHECSRQGIEPTPAGLVAFIIEHDLVVTTDINRYMAIELYPEALWHSNGVKRQAVQYLEDRLPVRERKLWQWLGKIGGRYKTGRRRGAGGRRRA